MDIIENREAQFMLLAGFIIATVLVIITVLFNNIIFQTNIAGSTGADPLKYDIANMMQITSDEMKSAYRNATLQSGNKTQKINNFTMQMQNFNSNLSKIYSLRAGGVNMNIDVRNWNNSRYANFTENGTANGVSNWTVIENLNSTDLFNLKNITTTGTNFTVNVTNMTGAFLWSMKLNSSNITINKTWFGPGTCSFTRNDSVNILSIPNSTTCNTPSYVLYQFSSNVVGSNYKIQIINGSDASGTFNMTGNTTDGRRFTRARDYMLNATVTLSTSEIRANITIPISVPW